MAHGRQQFGRSLALATVALMWREDISPRDAAEFIRCGHVGPAETILPYDPKAMEALASGGKLRW